VTTNGKGKRDERIRELHERGLSLRAIGRRVGLSRQQVHRILAAMATGEPGEVVAVLADVDDDMEDAGPRSQWSDEQRVRALLSELRNSDGDMRDLTLYRLAHMMPPEDFQKLCAKIGRTGSFGQTPVSRP
jgi:AraC-like DNA-binding protein